MLAENIYQAITFFEDHLFDEVRISDAADTVGFSLYHFCRSFNRIVCLTPYEYLLRRRLAQTAQVLVKTDKNITDIAFENQFNNLETFCRAFKRQFGMQPNQWRRQGLLDPRRMMPAFTREYLFYMEAAGKLLPDIVELQQKVIQGVSGFIQPDRLGSTEMWARLPKGSVGWGLSHWCIHKESVELFYLAGREGVEAGWFVSGVFPGGLHAHFCHHGGLGERLFLLDYIYHTWLLHHGMELAGDWELETRGEKEKECADIYIPVRKITH